MKRRKLITRCNYPWGDFSPTHAINHYLGCAFNCPYCWSRDIWWKRMGGHLSKAWEVPEDFEWHKPIMMEPNLLDQMLHHELCYRGLPGNSRVLLCSTTDPYQPDRDNAMTGHIIGHLRLEKVPIIMLTKSGDVPQIHLDNLANMDAWFGVTIDKEPALDRRNHQRMLLLHQAYVAGIKTFVSLEPWIPGVDALQIVTCISVIAKHWIIGRLNYKGVGDEFYRENLPRLIELLEGMGVSYYIKPDLKHCLEG